MATVVVIHPRENQEGRRATAPVVIRPLPSLSGRSASLFS